MAAMNMNREQFEQLIRGEEPVLVDFWAPWCGYCRRISPVLDQLAQQYDGQLVVGKINVDEQSELETQFGVEIIPTLYLFRNGVASEPIVNPGSKAQIVEWAGL